jgi:hypothetical protein
MWYGCVVPQLFAAGENRVVSRFLGRNQQPTIPRVQDPDNTPLRPVPLGSPTPTPEEHDLAYAK